MGDVSGQKISLTEFFNFQVCNYTTKKFAQNALRKNCLYSELFWSVFSRIRTEYGEILRNPVRMRENTDQNNSEYEHFYAVMFAFCSSFVILQNCLLTLTSFYFRVKNNFF